MNITEEKEEREPNWNFHNTKRISRGIVAAPHENKIDLYQWQG